MKKCLTLFCICLLAFSYFGGCQWGDWFGGGDGDTYTVTYDGNGDTGGSVPTDTTEYEEGQTVTVLGNTGNFVKAGYHFVDWNTQADGNGTSYTQGQTFTLGSANEILYAKWIVPSESHIVHTTQNARGPNTILVCGDCHDTSTYSGSIFADGKDLDTTGVCDSCHSPGGAYDGVNDTVIGAKNNWTDGVYNGSSLSPVKERWCAGCHDDQPANSRADGSGIYAPDIAGDNVTYGFYVNGHGRTSADKNCLDCHDAAYTHIDGDARTYAFASSYYASGQSGVAYQAGYRLKSIDGSVPLMIPTNYGTTFSYNAQTMRDNAFKLCFDCHKSSLLLDDTPGDGIASNFKASSPYPPRNYSYAWGSGADVNEHVAHIMNYVGPFWDSDWNTATTGSGGINGHDSLTACSACHNVHGAAGIYGSTNEVMIRDGRLTGRSGYGFSYVFEDTANGGYPMVTSTGATKSNSTGAIFRNNTGNMCAGSMCHGNPAPPAGNSYDASGSGWGTYLEYYRPYLDY